MPRRCELMLEAVPWAILLADCGDLHGRGRRDGARTAHRLAGRPRFVSGNGRKTDPGRDRPSGEAGRWERSSSGPGSISCDKGIVIEKAQRIALRGADAEGVVLKLGPPAICRDCGSSARPGPRNCKLRKAQNIEPGMLAALQCRRVAVDSVSKKPKPYVLGDDQEHRRRPHDLGQNRWLMPFPRAPRCAMRMRPNLIEIRGRLQRHPD